MQHYPHYQQQQYSLALFPAAQGLNEVEPSWNVTWYHLNTAVHSSGREGERRWGQRGSRKSSSSRLIQRWIISLKQLFTFLEKADRAPPASCLFLTELISGSFVACLQPERGDNRAAFLRDVSGKWHFHTHPFPCSNKKLVRNSRDQGKFLLNGPKGGQTFTAGAICNDRGKSRTEVGKSVIWKLETPDFHSVQCVSWG